MNLFFILPLNLFIVLAAEIQRLRQELEAALERAERQRDALQQKLAHLEKDYQTFLQQAKLEHEDDVARISQERVGD